MFEKFEKERYYTVNEKIVYVIRYLYRMEKEGEQVEFLQLFEDSHGRNEIIATFLALLELVKSGRVDVKKQRNELFLLLSRKHTEGKR